MEFYVPCVDYLFVIALKALYEILVVARLSYTAEALQVRHIFQHYYILHFIKCKTH
jgi:hypothetical protein